MVTEDFLHLWVMELSPDNMLSLTAEYSFLEPEKITHGLVERIEPLGDYRFLVFD